MRQPIVIALDPGKVTGFAMWNYPEGHVNVGQGEWMEVAHWLHAFCQAVHGRASYEVTIVSESFVITQATLRKSRENWSLEFIGLARYLAWRYLGTELRLQSPADAKSFASDDKLKRVGWYRAGTPHGVDAARHLLLYTVRNTLIPITGLVERDAG